jgi:hypothetical protein
MAADLRTSLIIAHPATLVLALSLSASNLSLFTGTDLGIGFRNANEGFVAGDSNGVGPQIMKTMDGGLTWNNTQANFGASWT